MLTLNAQSIKDYQVCPFFYEKKYVDKLDPVIRSREAIYDKFEDILRRVVTFFFYKKQGGAVPSYNTLLNRWEKLWFPKGTTAYDLSIERHESAHHNIASLSNAAAAAFLQFYEDFYNSTEDPILIDEKFLIPINKEIRIEGVFDVVLRQKDKYHIIRWSTRTKRPPIDSFNYDFAIQKLAFAYRNKFAASVEYTLYDLGSTTPGAINFVPKTDDINAIAFWANEIYNSKINIPRRGLTVYCRGCEYDTPCKRFKYPKEGIV